MNGEPDRRMILAGPFDAVFYARRNENIVAGGQSPDPGLAFKTQARPIQPRPRPIRPRADRTKTLADSSGPRKRSARSLNVNSSLRADRCLHALKNEECRTNRQREENERGSHEKRETEDDDIDDCVNEAVSNPKPNI
jgi:hypothetical protein